MFASPETEPSSAAARHRRPESGPGAPSFEEVYDEHAEMVWRSLRRLGVPEASVDDAPKAKTDAKAEGADDETAGDEKA